MNALVVSLQRGFVGAPWAERLGWTLLHSLWQITVVALVYALLSFLLRKRSASVRYICACGALLVMMVLTVGTYLALPSGGSGALPAAEFGAIRAVTPDAGLPMRAEMLATRPHDVAIGEVTVLLAPEATPVALIGPSSRPLLPADALRPWTPWLAIAWVLGVCLFSLRPLCGCLHVRRLQRCGLAPLSDPLQRLAEQSARRLKVKRVVEFMQSTLVKVPTVVGLLRPLVLLPASVISGLSAADIDLILAHELAHVRRHDYLVNVIQTVLETLLFFHPAMWWVTGRIRKEREHCCDDLAVQVCGDRVTYARALAKLEGTRVTVPVPALAASGGSLLERTRRIVGRSVATHSPRSIWMGGIMAMLSAGVAVSLAIVAGTHGGDEFDLRNPPDGYEKGVRMAKPDHSIKAGGLRLKLSELTEGDGGFLQASLGASNGFEVTQFRLFDSAMREYLHGSALQRPGYHKKDFFIERVGATEVIRMKETGGTLPEKIDIWMRLIEHRPGRTHVLDDKIGASASVGTSRIVLVSLFDGVMDGGTGPSGDMVWDAATLHDEGGRTTVELHNQGVPLQGNYAVVAVTAQGQRHAQYFGDFSKVGREPLIMKVPRKQIDHLELVPVRTDHKFFFNGVAVPRTVLPKLSSKQKREVARLLKQTETRSDAERDRVAEMLVAIGTGVAPSMIPLLRSGKTDQVGVKVLEALAPDPAVQRFLVKAISEARANGPHPNTVHCGLIALSKSKNRRHVDFVASFMKSNDIMATSVLAELGGEEARDHLIQAFEIVPTEHWWLLSEALERLGDPVAIPELKKRLGEVELPPNESFPARTAWSMINAIESLSGERMDDTLQSYCQGQHFRYPYNGPGSPKTFSVNPVRNHYVNLPKVDPKTVEGRKAIWQAMEKATEGAGFTIDGDEVVALNGLKLAPLWIDGPPYPTTWYDWLEHSSHKTLLQRVAQERQTGRCTIPKSGLLVTLDPDNRICVLILKKTSDESTYTVNIQPQNPYMQLIPVGKDIGALKFTRLSGCTLHDLESGTENGVLNLSRAHMVTLTEERWRTERQDAILTAEFAGGRQGLAIPGAKRFLLAEAGKDWDLPEKVIAQLQQAEQGKVVIAGHKVVESKEAIFHTFQDLQAGRKFAFAVTMPTGIPVAGVLEVRDVDRKAETLEIRHRFLPTTAARAVFSETDLSLEPTGLSESEPVNGLRWWIGVPNDKVKAGEEIVVDNILLHLGKLPIAGTPRQSIEGVTAFITTRS